MQDATGPLQQRAQRRDLSFPVVFRDVRASRDSRDGGGVRGNCLNLSESGMLAIFEAELDLWDRGEVVLAAGDLRHTQPARVARVNDREVGLAFIFGEESERAAIRRLLAVAAESPQLVGPPPF